MSIQASTNLSRFAVVTSVLIQVATFALPLFPMDAVATVVSAGSTIAAGRPADAQGSESWWFSTPDATDTISYTSGLNVTDNIQHVKQPYGPEGKFNTGAGAPTGRNFTGFTDPEGPGPAGSTTKTYGWGDSSVKPNLPFWGNLYFADWTVGAEGKKGTGAFPSWSATASAQDPWTYGSSDFANWGITSSDQRYDLYFAVGLDSATFSSVGDMHLTLLYQTTSQMLDLLDIGIDSNGNVSVNSPVSPSTLTFYRQTYLQEGPLESIGSIIDTDGIKSLLQGDFADNGIIDNPLYLGLVLNDISNPLVGSPFDDGSYARILVNTDVSASVPEPGTLLIVGVGLLGLVGTKRRRTKASKVLAR